MYQAGNILNKNHSFVYFFEETVKLSVLKRKSKSNGFIIFIDHLLDLEFYLHDFEHTILLATNFQNICRIDDKRKKSGNIYFYLQTDFHQILKYRFPKIQN